MKKLLTLALCSGILCCTNYVHAQDSTKMETKMPEDKSKRPSPPDSVSATIASGAMVSINYSEPSVKGRTIGKDLEPMNGKVWRTGANEATVFETDKDVKIDGKSLKAGKYGFFTLWNGSTWTLIFNKTWNQWGAFKYQPSMDALRVTVKNMPPPQMSEKMTFMIDQSGKVTLAWGNVGFDFMVM